MKTYFPILSWLPSYSRSLLKGDIVAGLTVGVMLIPQGMAYAMLAGLPPIYGLYASTIPIIIYSLMGTSRQLAVGPVAMVSLLTASSVGLLAEGGTDQYILLAITLAFLVGMIQFSLGVFRMGFLVSLLSHPVISGFTSAAALIIGSSQLKHLLGIEIPRSHHVHEILYQAFLNINETNLITLGIGLVGIVIIKSSKKIHSALPGPLIAVVVSVLSVYFFGFANEGVKIVGAVPSGLPSFSTPVLDVSMWRSLLPAALAISLVSFMESIAVAKAIQARHKNYKIIPNQELIALGLANIVGSLFQSYPVTGGFSRTAVNDQAGAKTGIAGIIAASLIILTLLFFTPLFYYLPKAILASVIMVAVFGLIDFKEAKHLWNKDRADFFMLLATFIFTLLLGIEIGIAIGVILSLLMIIFRTSRPHVAVLGEVEDSGVYRNVTRFKDLRKFDNILIVRFDADLYFANTEYFKTYVEDQVLHSNNQIRHIVLDAQSISHVDSSAIHMLEELTNELGDLDIRIYFSGVKGPVRDTFKKNSLFERIGENHFFFVVQDAIDFIQSTSTQQIKRSLVNQAKS